jgi:hypothetical protein
MSASLMVYRFMFFSMMLIFRSAFFSVKRPASAGKLGEVAGLSVMPGYYLDWIF